MPGMTMGAMMAPSTTNLADPMSREGSGTSWLPDSTPMYGRMFMKGSNMLMVHGAAWARYTDVGVKHLLMDASGGRSIVEALPGQVNGYNVAQAWWNQGYRGCWVFALGTNDTANVSVGSAVGLMGRINEMMSAAHGEPVVWVNTITQTSSGPWSEANQQLWDSTLVSALARYPNMRILNWAAVAQPGWFLPDGIHYNQAGCAARAQAIADGLARAFPRYGQSHGPIVG